MRLKTIPEMPPWKIDQFLQKNYVTDEEVVDQLRLQ